MNRIGVIGSAILAVEAMGSDASVRSVQAMCVKICGKHLRPADILDVLREKRHPETLGKRIGNAAETPTVLNSTKSGNVSETDRKPLTCAPADHNGIGLSSLQGEDTGVATGTDRPSVSQSGSPSPEADLVLTQPPSLRLVAPAEPGPAKTPEPKPAKAPKPPKPDPRTPAERAADEAIDLLRPRIEPVLAGMTWTTWRQRNRRFVVDMAQAGMSPFEIDAAHRAHSERKRWAATIEMRWVQADVTNGSATIAAAGDDGLEDNPWYIPEGPDDPPWEPTDLKLEDIPEDQRAPWKLPPDHWRYRPAPEAVAW